MWKYVLALLILLSSQSLAVPPPPAFTIEADRCTVEQSTDPQYGLVMLVTADTVFGNYYIVAPLTVPGLDLCSDKSPGAVLVVGFLRGNVPTGASPLVAIEILDNEPV